MKKATNSSRRMTRNVVSAAFALCLSGAATAATVSDTMVNKAVIADACDVVAIGVDFGTVPMPLVADFPGALPNLADDGGDTLSVLGISVPFTAAPGVFVVCTATPTSIALTSPNSAGGTLSTAIGGSPVTTLTSKMTDGGSQSLDYTMTLTGSALGVGGLGLPVGTFAATYAGAGLIPSVQSGTYGPGTYTDTVTVTITY